MNHNREFAYFCLGCTVGAAAAAIFTPASGRETVNYVRQKAGDGTQAVKEGSDYVRRRVEEAAQAIVDGADRGKKTLRSQVEGLGAAVGAAKKAYRVAQNA